MTGVPPVLASEAGDRRAISARLPFARSAGFFSLSVFPGFRKKSSTLGHTPPPASRAENVETPVASEAGQRAWPRVERFLRNPGYTARTTSPRSGRQTHDICGTAFRPLCGLFFPSQCSQGSAKCAPPWATLSRPRRGLQMSKLQRQASRLSRRQRHGFRFSWSRWLTFIPILFPIHHRTPAGVRMGRYEQLLDDAAIQSTLFAGETVRFTTFPMENSALVCPVKPGRIAR